MSSKRDKEPTRKGPKREMEELGATKEIEIAKKEKGCQKETTTSEA